jgi:energy-coupling factor transporter ATP-binding protein EcfA2
MRLVKIHARDVKPIKLVDIQSMSDTVVLAGPNGVGKTRLVVSLLEHIQGRQTDPNFSLEIHATNATEKAAWKKDVLHTHDPTDVQLLQTTIQRSRRRSNFASSFLNFESNRTIQQVQAFNWDWNFGDPFEEEINWNVGMTNMTNRFQDMMHSIFRKMRSRREAIALHYEGLVKARAAALSSELSAEERERRNSEHVGIDPRKFPDALEPFKRAFSQLLAPKELLDPEIKNQQLFYRTETGDSLPITALSSGEREVVNIVFDFLLRAPSDCVIVFDEPELHLHPELSYRLLQTLRRTGARNQFIFCTHSSEIITASLNNTVIFIAPPKSDLFNQALVVKADDETHQALKLLGQSIGIISLGKKLVLIEGEQGSLDKQTYGAILKDRFPALVLVPSGGKALLQSFSAVNQKVLSKTIWGVEFFMLSDRDALPLDDSAEIERKGAGRIRLLKRYHLENYFLDEHTIAKVFEPLTPDGDRLRSPDVIRSLLKSIARKHASYATALSASAFFREEVGNVDLMPAGCNGKTAAELAKLVIERSRQERGRVMGLLDDTAVEKYVGNAMKRLENSLNADTDDWKSLIPGRVILKEFCSGTPLQYENFRTAFINAADCVPTNPFAEIIEIFETFNRMPGAVPPTT